MDYFSLAEKMLSVRARLSHLPAGEAVSDACGGEFFALSLLLLDDAPGCPSGLSRSMGVSSARIAALSKRAGSAAAPMSTTSVGSTFR